MENQANAEAAREDAPQPDIFNESDRVVIATPCYGGFAQYEHMLSVTDAHDNLHARFRNADGSVEVMPVIARRLYLTNESHIDRARNKVANMFMRSRYNWLLFWDADVVAPKEAVAIVWAHGMRGERMVGAPYATKGVVPHFAINIGPGAKKEETGLVEVINAGTGFLLVHRSVLEALEREGRADEYFVGSNDPERHISETARAYFKSGVRKIKRPDGVEVKLWLSEDYMLCYEWQKCGGRVVVDYRPQLEHIGTAKFPLNGAEIAAAHRELKRIGHPAVA